MKIGRTKGESELKNRGVGNSYGAALIPGKNLDQMYIASANTKWIRQGDIQPQWPHSGDIFTVDFGPGSEVRKLLGEDWKGAERHRFAA